MAMVFVGIAEIFVDFGLRQAIVQAPQPTASLLSSCFWLNAGIGILAALLLAALAPVIAALYQEPRITPLLPFLGLNLVVATLSTVPRALLQRDMHFGVLTRLSFVAGLIGATAGCTMAVLGWGVWSLIVQPLVSSLVGTIMAFSACRWRPGFEFSSTGLHSVVRFSGGVLGASLLNYLNRNADNLLVGRFLGAGALGYYSIAYGLMVLPLTYVSSSIGGVAYPALVQLQDDMDRYKRAYLKTCSAIAFVSFPMMCGLFVVADEFVAVILGSKWLAATAVVKILCPLGLVQSIATTVGLIYTSTGRTKTLFLWTLGATPFLVLSFVVGLPWGIEGVAASYAVVFYTLTYISFRIAFGIIGLAMRSLLSVLWRSLICALAMAGTVYLLDRVVLEGIFSELPRLAVDVLSGGTIYLLLSIMINRHELSELIRTGRAAIGAAPDISRGRRHGDPPPGLIKRQEGTMVDNAATDSVMAELNPAARGRRDGTFAIMVPWLPAPEGGVNQVVINLYKEIERAGPFVPLVIVSDWGTLRQREQIAAGCRTVLMRLRAPSGASARHLLVYLLTLPWTMIRLRRLIINYDIKVVNAQFPSLQLANFALLAASGFYSGKLVLSFQGRDIHQVIASRGLDRWLWRWLLGRADHRAFCSRQLATYLHDFAPELETVAVHNGICPQDLLDEKRSTAAERLPPGPYILNVGAFEHKKGQDVLIRAFARLAPHFPNVHLVLLGQKEPTAAGTAALRERLTFYDEVTRLVATLDVRQRIHFRTDVPHGEVLGYLEKATVFAFPSRAEPLGIAMLEAGVFAVPVVASRTGESRRSLTRRRSACWSMSTTITIWSSRSGSCLPMPTFGSRWGSACENVSANSSPGNVLGKNTSRWC